MFVPLHITQFVTQNVRAYGIVNTDQVQNTSMQLHACHITLMPCTNKPTYFCRLCDRHQGALQEY